MLLRFGLIFFLALPGLVQADDPACHVIVSFAPRHGVFTRIKELPETKDRRELCHRYDRQLEAAGKAFSEFYSATHPELLETVHLGFGLYNFIFPTPEQAKAAQHSILKGCEQLLGHTEFEVSTAPNHVVWTLP